MAYASKLLDNSSGFDESFTTGYAARAFAEDFLYQQAYGSYLLDTKKQHEWIVTKTFSPSITYATNVSGTRRDAKDDIIYGYSSGVGVARQFKKIFISTFYSVAGTQNVEQEESNTVNHSFGQSATYTGNRIGVTFSNTLQPAATYATGERTELDVNNQQKVVTWADNANLNVAYKVSPKTKVDYNLAYKLYYFPVAQNSTTVNSFSEYTFTMGPRMTYQILPKVSIFTSYEFARSYFFEGGDFSSKSDTVNIGGSVKITPKMSANASLGYSMLSYDTNVLGFDSVTLSYGLTRRLTQKIFMSAGYSTSTTEDFDALAGQNKTQLTQNYLTNLSWKITPRASLAAGASMIINSKEGFITLRDPDNETLTFTREQEDVTYEWNTTYSWNPAPYVGFVFGYRFINNNSSFVDFESDDQRIFTQANCRF